MQALFLIIIEQIWRVLNKSGARLFIFAVFYFFLLNFTSPKHT